jgi:hypothetical protein
MLLPDMFVWFGKHGIVLPESMTLRDPTVKLNIFHMFGNDDGWVATVLIGLCLSSCCLTIGCLTRIATITVFVILASLYHRNPYLLNSGDTYMRMLAFWLIFSPSGKMLSFDHWLACRRFAGPPKKASASPIWSLRLLQIQMCLVYAQSFFAKLSGSTWLDGTAVYYSSRLVDLHRLAIPYVFDHLWTCKLLTWGTLAIELALFTLIWWRQARYFVLAAGVIQHLVIEWHMNIPVFQWLMIVSYVLFIDGKDLTRWLGMLHSSIVPQIGDRHLAWQWPIKPSLQLQASPKSKKAVTKETIEVTGK